MKYIRPLLLTLVLLFAATGSTYAQEHLKFMGIPIDGTIDNFQKQLATKDIVVEKSVNKNVGVGMRIFKGRFAGKTCFIAAQYSQSKTVYSVMATYVSKTAAEAAQFYATTKQLLKEQCTDGDVTDTVDAKKCPVYKVFLNGSDGKTKIGVVSLTETVNKTSKTAPYMVNVAYVDALNNDKNLSEKQGKQ